MSRKTKLARTLNGVSVEQRMDQARLRACGQLKAYLVRIEKYYDNPNRHLAFARFHDKLNLLVTGETAKQMRRKLSLLLGRPVSENELIRDYFPITYLQKYSALCEGTANLLSRGMTPHEALSEAASILLPLKYVPKPIDFEGHLQLVRSWGLAS